MDLDRFADGNEIFEAALDQRDYFYDPDMHGRDWTAYDRYARLVPFIRHRSSLNYILDQMNGELSVGHSFVSTTLTAMTWATTPPASWGRFQPRRRAVEDRPHLHPGILESGAFESLESPWTQHRSGTLSGRRQRRGSPRRTTCSKPSAQRSGSRPLHINSSPEFDGAWTHVVEPIRSENALRKRAWVEDNRRRVDELSDGKLAYVWVPNTAGARYLLQPLPLRPARQARRRHR